MDNPLTAFNLRVLCTLIEEGNVTHAARRLNLSQPATSLILKQLREIFRDELLVRSGGRMVPTEHAHSLYRAAQTILSDLNELILHPEEFEPHSLDQTFTIGLSDTVSPALAAGLAGEAEQAAPSVRLVLRRLAPDFDVDGALATGGLDLAVGHWLHPPHALRRAVIIEEDLVCLVDRRHAFADAPPTIADFGAACLVVPPGNGGWLPAAVEMQAGVYRTARDETRVVCDYLMAPHLLVGTDLVLTASRSFAAYHAGILPLAVVACPLPYPRVPLSMLWHERTDHSLAQKWLRQLLVGLRRKLGPVVHAYAS